MSVYQECTPVHLEYRTGDPPVLWREVVQGVRTHTFESMQAEDLGPFDPIASADIIRKQGNKNPVAAIDVGAKKATALKMTAQPDKLEVKVEKILPVWNHENGIGIVDYLERVYLELKKMGIERVGISSNGLFTRDGIMLKNDNSLEYIGDLYKRYNGSLADIFPGMQVKVDNDAIDALKAAAIVFGSYNIVLVILGGGNGGGGLNKGRLTRAEPGHDVLPYLLNFNKESRDCNGGVSGKGPCWEMVSGGAWIEKRFNEMMGYMGKDKIDGKEIAKRLESPKRDGLLAAHLYLHAAQTAAIESFGIANALKMLGEDDLMLVFHGGVFNVDFVKSRTERFINYYFPDGFLKGFKPRIRFVRDYDIFYDRNASALGAGYSGLLIPTKA